MSTVRVTHLKCEYQSTPLGIGEAAPRLSWQLESDQRGVSQTAYRILAASTEQNLSADRADLWDSGKVAGDSSLFVPYVGKPIGSRQRVFWKVRVWDENDDGSDYSAPGWWETGLLDRAEWTGDWIGSEQVGGPRSAAPAPFLRKTFATAKPIASARLYVTALGLYEFHINGKRVGNDCFAPYWTDYRQRVQYQVYDVSRLLTEGENAVGAVLGDGWYCGHVGWRDRQYYGDRPIMLAQLVVRFADGSEQTIVTDATWKTLTGPILEADLLMGETYDARLELPGWDTPGHDDSAWSSATVFPDTEATLDAMRGPAVRPIAEIVPVADPTPISEGTESRWIFDLGQNMIGRVRLKVRGDAGTTVVLRHAEVLNADGSLYTTNLRSAKQTDSYTLKGGAEEVFEPRFTFHGFRYVELSGLPGTPTRDTVTGIVLHSDTPPTGTFESSDPLLNQLQHNIQWGQKGNFLDVPTDCPQRDERLGWTGDAQVFVQTATFNADVAGFFAKWLTDVRQAQTARGEFPPIVPNIDVVGNDGGPAWADAAVICPWAIYLNYGDAGILAENYPAIAKYLDFLQETSLGLIRCHPDTEGWTGFGDWLALDGSGKTEGGTPRDLIGTAFLAYSARLTAKMARILGKAVDAAKYEALYEATKQAFQRRYVTPEGLVTPQSQTAFVLALYFDLLPQNLRANAAKELVRDIKTRGMHLSTGFVGTPYLTEVLTEAGYLDVAYDLLFQKSWPSWLYSVTQGATTIWERWDGWTEDRGFQDAGMNSFNHYAYGAIGNWLYQTVAGIAPDPDRPGYRHIVMRPRPGGGLTSAKASLASPCGLIASEWRIEDGAFRWSVTIPPNATATVTIPTTASGAITESDKPVDEAVGLTFVRREEGAAVYEAASGRYELAVG